MSESYKRLSYEDRLNWDALNSLRFSPLLTSPVIASGEEFDLGDVLKTL